MSKVYTTEITSEEIPSDNPIHQRLLKPYIVVSDIVGGDLLEVGCGEGRGIGTLIDKVRSYTAVDKIATVIDALKVKFPSGRFIAGNIPPLKGLADNAFDFVVSFQVIEHLRDDHLFLKEIHRVLRPGGLALITTPNRPMSLSRNPWHIREYSSAELTELARRYFGEVVMKGITGNDKVMTYYERNKRSVDRLMRFDVFDLQHKLPAALLKLPYELLNRWNRDKLNGSADELTRSIHNTDYLVTDQPESALDLFLQARK